MKATIIAIESGSKFVDKRQRVILAFKDADHAYSEVRFQLDALGTEALGTGPHLDQEVEVTFSAVRGARK